MRSIFKNRGFDTIISDGNDYTCLAFVTNGTVLLYGMVSTSSVSAYNDAKTQVLKIFGRLYATEELVHPHLVVSGIVVAGKISVGRLVVRKTASLQATSIEYDELVIEPGAYLDVGKLSKKVPQPVA
jgi:hypothetical protein